MLSLTKWYIRQRFSRKVLLRVVVSNYVLLSPRKLGKMNPFWRAYFSKGLDKNHQPQYLCDIYPDCTFGTISISIFFQPPAFRSCFVEREVGEVASAHSGLHWRFSCAWWLQKVPSTFSGMTRCLAGNSTIWWFAVDEVNDKTNGHQVPEKDLTYLYLLANWFKFSLNFPAAYSVHIGCHSIRCLTGLGMELFWFLDRSWSLDWTTHKDTEIKQLRKHPAAYSWYIFHRFPIGII